MNGALYAAVLLWVGIAFVVALDASERERNSVVWFLAVLVSGLFGLVAYLLVLVSSGPSEPTDRELESAVFAVRDYLRNEGPATEAEIRDALFQRHPVGYDDGANWWAAFIQPELTERAEFERTDEGWTVL